MYYLWSVGNNLSCFYPLEQSLRAVMQSHFRAGRVDASSSWGLSSHWLAEGKRQALWRWQPDPTFPCRPALWLWVVSRGCGVSSPAVVQPFLLYISWLMSWGRPRSSTVWAAAALWDGNADGIVKCSQLLTAWLLTVQTNLLLGPRLLSLGLALVSCINLGVVAQHETVQPVTLAAPLQSATIWRCFLRSGWTGGGILCCRWVEHKACWMTSD